MLSVLIETQNDEEALAMTLASLVSGAVEGIVREVIVLDRASTDHTRLVAEHAGCYIADDTTVSDCLSKAKGHWVLILEPGARLVDGWVDEVMRYVSRSDSAARFSRSRAARVPFLARIFASRRALREGLLIPKSRALILAKTAESGEAIARGLATRLLPAEIVPARREK